VVYVGSYLADSLLVKLHHTPWRNPNQSTLEIPLDITTLPPEQVTHPVTQEGVVIDAKGDYVEVLEEFPNLAPVGDAVLVDLTGGGQVRRTPAGVRSGIRSPFQATGGYVFRRGLFREHQGRRSRS